ncbi:hypothetical protein COEREDRAFT_86710 [Coemansia reversa NRRL 1564]|uniref:Uncharacterized protein n=1 Tax=Coemansia reversa (strain ATCC 12441 / NRRL 1564) TaxID=763665 RepID=A0A2G5BD30_COERN|nr:hypothetical protein COEREDRAFT_86710 [Coemansia reversa NRRL 1564]|eukprot:PIA16617.1 hypothetical protein COEREDRAFT_86710 [Coemansia reversa NRRL 1564]
MASATAPPLSLSEFRLFISHDPKARNALAFCEWYQRYKTVYFDRLAPSLSAPTSGNKKPKIVNNSVSTTHGQYKQSISCRYWEHKSVRPKSVSIPDVHHRRRSDSAIRDLFMLKSHSFCAFDRNTLESAFHSVSTSSTSVLDGLLVHPCTSHSQPSPTAFCALRDIPQNTCDAQSNGRHTCYLPLLSRRCTLPNAASITWPEYEARHEEKYRRSIQSLLVFECWARFLCANAHELVDIPEQELLYVLERLPLNITHLIPQLLCCNDMLVSKPSIAGFDVTPTDSAALELPKVLSSPNMDISTAENAFHGSLQNYSNANHTQGCLFQTCQRHKPPYCTTLAHLSAAGKYNDNFFTNYSSGHNATTNGFLTGLLYPLRPVHLVAVTQLQKCHNALRPRPNFTAPVLDAASVFSPCSYQSLPEQLTRLIIPNNVPPALFETMAKLSAEYLHQNYFADFYSYAHCNVSASEQKVALMLALAFFVLAVGAVAIFIAMDMSVPWRMFSVPIFLCAIAYLGTAWSRVSIWRWYMCRRPTYLVLQNNLHQEQSREKLLQSKLWADSDLYPSSAITIPNWDSSRWLLSHDKRCNIMAL